MSFANYSSRKAERLTHAGPLERACAEMRGVLERYISDLLPQNSRVVDAITPEERLREALSQRASPRQLFDVIEQRFPHTGPRMDFFWKMARAMGTPELLAALGEIDPRHQPGPAPAGGPSSSLVVEPSLPPQPPLPPPAQVPPPPGRREAAEAVEAKRRQAIDCLSSLTRDQCRDLAYELNLTIGLMEELERKSDSTRDFVRRVLTEYFERPNLHRGDQFGNLVRTMRRLEMNMTADRLAQAIEY